jgi:hypothetical protein
MLYYLVLFVKSAKTKKFGGGMFQAGVFIQGEDQTVEVGKRRMSQIFHFVTNHAVFTVGQKHLLKKF